MSRVGIVTFHRAENFGAVMQSYALQTVIERLGHEAVIIDYRNKTIERNYHILNPAILLSRKNIIASISQYLYRFKNLKQRYLKKKYYRHFRQQYLHSIPSKELSDIECLITGSDQVWNMHITGGYDSFYFLDHASLTGKRKISYAASADKNISHLLKKHENRLRKALSDYKSLSVREDFLKDELAPYTDKMIAVALDPTFLLDKQSYLKIADKVKEKGYVLLYQMTKSEESERLAKQIAAERNLHVVEVFGGYGERRGSRVLSPSPTYLLGLFANAQAVVTTSFHGVAFSLIFQKDLWVIDAGNNLRQRNILEKAGIPERIIKSTKEAGTNNSIDYNNVNKKLGELINDSTRFLSEALK